MSFLFSGRILEVDLASGQHRVLDIPQDWYRQFFAGSGLGIRLLMGEPPSEPMAPENPLLFVKGLFNGTKVPSSSRVTVCARSPLTGIWGESCSGGFWGPELAMTGYDGILIRGRAPRPVYLWITEETVEIRDAAHLWGLDTFETHAKVLDETGPGARVASIGRAGEKGVLFASILVDGIHARAMGRAGMGAVMGSKNLKSIAVKGSRKPVLREPDALMAIIREDVPLILKKAQGLRNWSTAGGVETIEFLGDLPIKNWQMGSWEEGAKRIAGQNFLPKLLDHHHSCHSCVVRCAKIVRIVDGDFKGIFGHGPEYETLAGFGSNLLNDDYEVIIAANDLCNRLGMDTISTGAVIAFAMEAYEKGIIGTDDTAGLDLAWGNKATIVKLTEMIGNRDGEFAALLGEGVRRAATRFGGDSMDFAIQTKGLEYPYHDPRAFTCMSANYATSNRGACHLEALSYFLGRGVTVTDLGYDGPPDPHSNEGKGSIAYTMQNFMSVFNPLGICKFLFTAGVGPSHLCRWLSHAWQWEIGKDELMKAGERIFTLKRLFNNRLGVTAKDDVIPKRLRGEPRPSGKAAGVLPDVDRILAEYYPLRGWDSSGVPVGSTLERLDLQEFAPTSTKSS